MTERMSEEYRVGPIYWTGENPPRKGKVPEGFEWFPITNRVGRVLGYRLRETIDPTEGPPPYSEEDWKRILVDGPPPGIDLASSQEPVDISLDIEGGPELGEARGFIDHVSRALEKTQEEAHERALRWVKQQDKMNSVLLCFYFSSLTILLN